MLQHSHLIHADTSLHFLLVDSSLKKTFNCVSYSCELFAKFFSTALLLPLSSRFDLRDEPSLPAFPVRPLTLDILCWKLHEVCSFVFGHFTLNCHVKLDLSWFSFPVDAPKFCVWTGYEFCFKITESHVYSLLISPQNWTWYSHGPWRITAWGRVGKR